MRANTSVLGEPPRLHSLYRLDTEQTQARLHDGTGTRAEHETPGFHGRIVNNDAVRGVEGAVSGGEFVQVGAQVVRTELFERLVKRSGERQQLAGQRDFRGSFRVCGTFLTLPYAKPLFRKMERTRTTAYMR